MFNFVQTNEDDVSVHFTRTDMDGSVEVYVSQYPVLHTIFL